MIRGGSSSESIDHGLGLGPHLVGKSIEIHGRNLEICKQLGEGGFSFVYLVRSTNHCSSSLGSGIDNAGAGHGENAAAATNGTPTSNIHSAASLSSHQQPSLSDSSKHRRQTNPSPRPPLVGGGGGGSSSGGSNNSTSTPMVLKITSVHNNSQRLMAEKEAKLLQMLSHPSIIQVYDHGFREDSQYNTSGGGIDDHRTLPQHVMDKDSSNGNANTINASNNISTTKINTNSLPIMMKSAQHLILMEYCEGGTAFDAIKRMRLSASSTSLTPTRGLSNTNTTNKNSTTSSDRFDLPSLVISFGQICNAVSYLHAQRPPIIHRDLKPVNFLIKKGGAYKLCDFGSAVIGHTDLRTPENRRKAEEVVNKTTTQMFRAPEMVDLYMSKRLTQSTDVWALGCCLYSLAFLRDCFEEGSNLAILSRKYKIPEDNPYGDGLVDLIDRMLALDCKERADMSEVIMCLSALYSNRPLPQRKYATKNRDETTTVRLGAFRTDGQGIRPDHPNDTGKKNWKLGEAKKLDPNSAAAKRKKASEVQKQSNNLNTTTSSSIAFSKEIFDNGGEVVGQPQNNSKTTSSSSPPSLEDNFHNFASFERIFDDNQGTMEQFHDLNTTDESAATTSLLEDTFDSNLFEEQCQISVAPSSSPSPSKPLAATGVNGYTAEDANFEVMFQDTNATSLSSPLAILQSTTNHQNNSPSRRWNMSNNAPGSFPQLLPTTSSSGGADTIQQQKASDSNNSTKKKRGLFGSIRGKK